MQVSYDHGLGDGATHVRLASANTKVIVARMPGYIEFLQISNEEDRRKYCLKFRSDDNIRLYVFCA